MVSLVVTTVSLQPHLIGCLEYTMKAHFLTIARCFPTCPRMVQVHCRTDKATRLPSDRACMMDPNRHLFLFRLAVPLIGLHWFAISIVPQIERRYWLVVCDERKVWRLSRWCVKLASCYKW